MVNKELNNLVRLQELSTFLDESRRKIEDTPVRLEEIEAKLRGATGDLEEARNRQEESQKDRRKLEGEVSDLETKLSRYQDQVFAVKKNEEYQALVKEIADTKDDIARAEDRILEQMEATETILNEIQTKDGVCQNIRITCEQQKKDCLQERDRLAVEVERKAEDLKAIRSSLPKETLDKFDRLAKMREGMALSPIVDDSCLLCHVRIRPQSFQDLKLGTGLVQCGTCHRFLYIPETST